MTMRIPALAGLAILALVVCSATSVHAQKPSLRPAVLVTGDVVRIGDLVTDVDADKADIALFRAPDLGETGSVQVAAVMKALRPYLFDIDSGDFAEVSVTRASRMIGSAEIKYQIAHIAAERLRLSDPKAVTVTLDMPAPTLHLDIAAGPLMPARMNFDPRSGRFDVTFQSGDSYVRLTGSAVESYDAVVLTRPVARGDVLRASDLAIERRPKAQIQADTIRDADAAIGMAAQQALRAGQTIRSADLMRPQLVKRGEPVMMRYEAPGIVLTVRGKAEEDGSLGDTINILNIQSKRVIQGVVSGPGQITVTSLTPQVVTAAAALTKSE
ncbi:MAG: flagellar basal body P-ring formation chaperone FlgA [Pseudomonadota bacterium]